MIMADLLHIMLLGVFFYLNGAVLWELVWLEHYFGPPPDGGTWQQRANITLKLAFENFTNYCRDNHLHSSHPAFTVGSLHMSTLSDNPWLTAKGANCLQISRWLAALTHEIAVQDPTNAHKQARAAALWAFVGAFNIMQQSFWLSDHDVVALEQARLVSLNAYRWLCHESLGRGFNYYPMKPKCHLWDHTLRDSCRHRLSATTHWCFCDEDFIGRIKKLAARCHLRTMAYRVLQRWTLRFWRSFRR